MTAPSASRISLASLLGSDSPEPAVPWAATRKVEGAWTVAADATVIVVEGFVLRDVTLGRRVSSELLGPGDAAPGGGDAHDALGSRVSWRAGGGAVVVELAPQDLATVAADPSLLMRLHERMTDRAERLAATAAILHMPQVRDRLLALLWQLADRWGRVTPDGVLLRLPLTHDELGRMVGARRPTVTLAVGELVATGALQRAARRGYLLPLGSRDRLEQAA